MKQSKTTLILGILLAIVVAVLIAFQFNGAVSHTTGNLDNDVKASSTEHRSLRVFQNFLNF